MKCYKLAGNGWGTLIKPVTFICTFGCETAVRIPVIKRLERRQNKGKANQRPPQQLGTKR